MIATCRVFVQLVPQMDPLIRHPIYFAGESGMRGMAWIIGAVAVTAWGTTTPPGSRDRAGAKIAQFGDLL